MWSFFSLLSILHQALLRVEVWKCHPWVWPVSTVCIIIHYINSFSSWRVLSHLHLNVTTRYFNYRTTRFLAEEGFYKFHNWFDDRAWYPLGRIIGGTIYPGKTINCRKILLSCGAVCVLREFLKAHVKLWWCASVFFLQDWWSRLLSCTMSYIFSTSQLTSVMSASSWLPCSPHSPP